MQNFRIFFLAPLALVAACSGNDVRDTLGLDRTAPDEFVVYARPPLSVPPEFDLKPPRPGEENPHAVSTEAQARELLLGSSPESDARDGVEGKPAVETAITPVWTSDAPSGPTARFLDKLGVDAAQPNIRDTLRADGATAPKKAKKAKTLYERVVGADMAEPVVDAKKEAERLRGNRDAGKPVTEGETPVEEKKSKSVMDWIF